MEVWRPSKLARVQLEERRLKAVEWMKGGKHKAGEIADHFGVSVHTVYGWKARLKRQGSLSASVSTGRPRRLTDEQGEEIKALLRQGPLFHGYSDETWSTPRVRDVIGKKLGIWYHRDHGRKLLHELGFTPQKPEKRAKERDDKRVMTWVEKVLPELEKKGR